MRYYSHYIWESGSEEKVCPVSVVLQQVSKGKNHYLLAGVCEGEISGYFAEGLTEWFHKCFLELILRKKVCCNDIYKCLKKELEKLLGEWKECSTYSVQGILLCDDYFCLFRKGNGKCYVFNRRFNVKRRKDLFCSKNEELELLQGNVQKKIGILLCTPEFGTSLTEADMMGVLFEEPLNDGKISKRLREIRLSDLERGNMEPTGAVFIYLA